MNFVPQKYIVKSHREICERAAEPTKVKSFAISLRAYNKWKLPHVCKGILYEHFLILQENVFAVVILMFCLLCLAYLQAGRKTY